MGVKGRGIFANGNSLVIIDSLDSKWVESGIQRKKGAGRKKIHDGLEDQLF